MAHFVASTLLLYTKLYLSVNLDLNYVTMPSHLIYRLLIEHALEKTHKFQ